MTNLSEAISYPSDLFEKVLEETISRSDFSDLTHPQFLYHQGIAHNRIAEQIKAGLSETETAIL